MKWYHVVYDLNVIIGSIMIYLFVCLLVSTFFNKKLKKRLKKILVTLFIVLCILALFNIGFNSFYIDNRYAWFVSDFRQTISPVLSGIIGEKVMDFFEYPMIYFGKALIPLSLVSFWLYHAMQPDELKNARMSSDGYLKDQVRDGLKYKR